VGPGTRADPPDGRGPTGPACVRSRTPAVAASDGAGPEVVGDAGAVFDGEDPRALAQALLTALDGPDAAACRAQAERFSLDRCAARHEELYHGLRGR